MKLLLIRLCLILFVASCSKIGPKYGMHGPSNRPTAPTDGTKVDQNHSGIKSIPSYATFTSDLDFEENLEKFLKRCLRTIDAHKANLINGPGSFHYAIYSAIYNRDQSTLYNLCKNEDMASGWINFRVSGGITALHLAVYLGFDHGIDLILNHGGTADCSMENFKITPLNLATIKGSTHAIIRLLTAGARIDATDGLGRTALHWAAAKGYADCLRALLEKGSDTTITDNNGHKPLCLAYRSKKQNCIKALVQYGNDGGICCLECIKSNADNILECAVKNKNISAVKNILDIVKKNKIPLNINAQDRNGSSLISYVIESNEDQIIELLLTHKAILQNKEAIKYRDDKGNTLLHIACAKEMTDIIPILGRLIPINSINNDGYTAFDMALTLEYVEVMQALLNLDSRLLNKKNKDEENLLHIAVNYGYLNLFKFLLDKGINVNEKDSYDATPLHLASSKGYREMVSILLNNPTTKINEQDGSGWNALDFAVYNNHVDVINLLLGKGADINTRKKDGATALHIAAQNGQTEAVEILLNKGVQINLKKRSGSTALHIAASNGHKGVVSYLLSKGIHINEKDIDGNTPLHIAARNGNKEIVELLLNKGADINVKEKNGGTPLHLAVLKGRLKVVETLLKHKDININEKNSHNLTPLYIARIQGHERIVELLVKAGATTGN